MSTKTMTKILPPDGLKRAFNSSLFTKKVFNMTSTYQDDAIMAVSIVAITELQSMCITSHEAPQANVQVTI